MKHISKLILAAVMATTLAGCALESMAANDLATDWSATIKMQSKNPLI